MKHKTEVPNIGGNCMVNIGKYAPVIYTYFTVHFPPVFDASPLYFVKFVFYAHSHLLVKYKHANMNAH